MSASPGGESVVSAGAAANRTALIGSFLALSGAFAYGINIVGARICAQLGIRGGDIVVYRALILLPILAIGAVVLRRRLTLSADERPQVFRFAVAATGTALFYMTSLKYLPVSLAVTLFYTYPLILILLTPYLDRVRLPLRRWLVAIVAFTGVLIAVGPSIDGLDPRGVAFALLGSLFCAGMFISAARLTSDSTVTFFWCQLIALPLGLAFAYINGGLAEPAYLAVAILPLTVNIVGYFLGFLLQILAAPRISAASAGLLFLFEPVVAIVAAALVLGETISLVQGIGMVMVVLALAYDMLPSLRRSEAALPSIGP